MLSTVVSRWLGADPMQVLGTGGVDLGFLRSPGQPSDGSVQTTPFRREHGDVLRLYRAFFNREPDASGARYWIDTFDRGASLDVIAESFTQSAEFRNAYSGTSNAEYVRRVYRNVLGRAYDEAGYRYWLGMLDSRRLTRGTLVRWVAANAGVRQPLPVRGDPPLRSGGPADVQVGDLTEEVRTGRRPRWCRPRSRSCRRPGGRGR